MVTVASPPTITASLHERYQYIFDGQTGFLAKYNIEREEFIDLLGLSIIAGVDLLALGDPGVGKTWAIELLTERAMVGMRLFSHLLAKDQSVSELIGEKDVMAMKEGRTARITTGTLVDSHFAYLDEIFKASPPALNPMLDIFAKRQLKIGGKTIDCRQLITILMSSNELPDREDLAAFRDRIATTYFVEPVKTPEGRRAVSDIQLDYDKAGDVDTSDLEPLTLDEIVQIRSEARQLNVPDPVRDKMNELEQKCLEAGHPISQRRKRDIWRMMRARAWSRGRVGVVMDDFLVAQHMAWNHPDHRKSARNIVTDLASRFTRQALRLRESMEAVEAEVRKLRQEAELLDEAAKVEKLDEGLQFTGQLRRLVADAESQIQDGEAEGEDVSATRDVLTDLKRTQKWVVNYLVDGRDSDEDE